MDIYLQYFGIWQYICESENVDRNICYFWVDGLLLQHCCYHREMIFVYRYRVDFGVIGWPIYVFEIPYRCTGLRDAASYFLPTIMCLARSDAQCVSFWHVYTSTYTNYTVASIQSYFGMFNAGENFDGFLDIWKWPLWCCRCLDTI